MEFETDPYPVIGETNGLIDVVWSIVVQMQGLMLDGQPLSSDQVIQLLPSAIQIAKMANYGV
jgi:hypothetical protein